MTQIRPDTEISGRRYSRTPIIFDSDRAPPLLARPSRATRCVPRSDSDSWRLAAVHRAVLHQPARTVGSDRFSSLAPALTRRDSDSGRLAACAHLGSRYSRSTRRPLLPHARLAHARQARRTARGGRGPSASLSFAAAADGGAGGWWWTGRAGRRALLHQPYDVRLRRSASPPLPTAALAGGGRRAVQGGGLCSTSLTRRLTRTGFQVLRRPRGGSREFG